MWCHLIIDQVDGIAQISVVSISFLDICLCMSAPRITLDQWRALLAVVDEGSYAKAAQALNKSQSSVTYSVQQLESQLDVKAFKIEGRKATLTPTGELLYRRARYLLDEAYGLEQSARRLSAGWEAEDSAGGRNHLSDLAAARMPRSAGAGQPAHAHRGGGDGARVSHRCAGTRGSWILRSSARFRPAFSRAAHAAALRARGASGASAASARSRAHDA
jgi:hypothetical protein